MREQRRPDDIAVAVNGVRAPQDRDRRRAARRIDRGVVKCVGEFQIFRRRRVIVAARRRIAAVEDRAETIGQKVPRFYGGDVRLNDLADFLLQRHPLHDFGDAPLRRLVAQVGGVNLRPDFGMDR